jgi:hypothetical protein
MLTWTGKKLAKLLMKQDAIADVSYDEDFKLIRVDDGEGNTYLLNEDEGAIFEHEWNKLRGAK